MTALRQHFDDGARDAEFAFDGLIGVSIRAERDRFTAIAGLGQFALQYRRRLGLGEQSTFEVQSRRQIHIGVGGARIAIDTAMFATAIGIDGQIERQVRRLVTVDDALRPFVGDGSMQWLWRLVGAAPAIVEARAFDIDESRTRRHSRATTFARFAPGYCVKVIVIDHRGLRALESKQVALRERATLHPRRAACIALEASMPSSPSARAARRPACD